jgi:hypothetical protein
MSTVDRAMATFNPIGKYVRNPIERAVPRLNFRGAFRQWSDVLIDTDNQVGFRQQDFRFAQLQNLLELEMSYALAPGLEVNAVTHAMYDGVYDWQNSGGLFADRNDRTVELYDNAERIMRELYVSYRRPDFDLLVGKQQVIWGKMDGQFIDIINGMDRREAGDRRFRAAAASHLDGQFHLSLRPQFPAAPVHRRLRGRPSAATRHAMVFAGDPAAERTGPSGPADRQAAEF